MKNLPQEWQSINFDEDDEPFYLRNVGRFKFFSISGYLVVLDPVLNVAKGVEVFSSDEMTLKMVQATAILKESINKQKQLSLF